MFKTIIKTIIGGALGAAALYAVGRIAYQLGYDMAEIDRKCSESDIFEDEPDTDDAGEDDCDTAKEQRASDISQEREDEQAEQVADKPARRMGKLRAIFQAAKAIKRPGKAASIISEVIKHPEKHNIDGFIE